MKPEYRQDGPYAHCEVCGKFSAVYSGNVERSPMCFHCTEGWTREVDERIAREKRSGEEARS